MKLFVDHRKNKGQEHVKKIKDKTPRILGPADVTIHARDDGPTEQLCGDSDVACEWINGEYSL